MELDAREQPVGDVREGKRGCSGNIAGGGIPAGGVNPGLSQRTAVRQETGWRIKGCVSLMDAKVVVFTGAESREEGI